MSPGDQKRMSLDIESIGRHSTGDSGRSGACSGVKGRYAMGLLIPILTGRSIAVTEIWADQWAPLQKVMAGLLAESF